MLLTNSAEGITPSGTVVTLANSGGVSGSAFDVVDIGASATVASSSTHAAHGGLGIQIATGITSAQADVAWSTSAGTLSQVWFRQYLYFTANPAGNIRINQMGAGSVGAFVRLTTTGNLAVVDLATTSVVTTTAATIPLNAWFRIEGLVTMSATVGQTELKLFTSMDSATPAETNTGPGNLNLGGASISSYFFGIAAATGSVAAFWMDDLGLSSTGYIGPVAPVTFGPAFPAPHVAPGWFPGAPGLPGGPPFPKPPQVQVPTPPPRPAREIGIAVSGAEFVPGNPGFDTTMAFSNRNKGVQNTDYHYEGVDSTTASNGRTFAFLYSRGWRTVKVPILWERLTDLPGSALNTQQVGYLTQVLNNASAAGLSVTLDFHNFGCYYLDGADLTPPQVSGTGYVQAMAGGTYVTQAHFADLWSRMTTQFLSHPAVVGVHLMNEPHDGVSGLTRALWYAAAQAAVTAIRAVDTTGLWEIRIGGYHWSDCAFWSTNNDTGLVVTDTTGHVWYEAHHYWWGGAGAYTTFADANTAAISRGFGTSLYPNALTAQVIYDLEQFAAWVYANAPGHFPLIGEIGLPNNADTIGNPGDQALWNAALTAYLARAAQIGVSFDAWSTGEFYAGDKLLLYKSSNGRTSGVDTPMLDSPPWEQALAPALAPFTVVQAAPAVEAASLTTATVTLPQPTRTGNTLVACITAGAATTNPAVSGVTLGGAADHWQAAVTDAGATAFGGAVWYDPNCAAGQTTVTVTCTGGAGTSPEIYVSLYEVSGVLVADATSTGDVASGATTWSSGGGPPVTGRPNEIFFAACTAVEVPVVTGVGDWTSQSTGLGAYAQVAGYQVVTTAGTATFSGTLPAAGAYTAVLATFATVPLSVPRPLVPAPGWFPAAPGLPGGRPFLAAPPVVTSAVTAVAAGATLAGAGSIGGVPAAQQAGATLGGAGSLGVPAAIQQATAALAGAGSLAAGSAQSAGATLPGAGSVSAPATQSAPATLAGAGSLATALRGPAFRGSTKGTSGTGTATTVTPAISVWTTADPQPGDIVFVTGFIMASAATWSQTAGTGTWTVHSSDSNAGGVAGMTSFAAFRLFDGTETTPTFTAAGVAAARCEWNICAFTPDTGYVPQVDTWATTVVGAAASSFTANAATCAGSSEVSLIMHCATAAANGTTTVALQKEVAWTNVSAGASSQAGNASNTSGTTVVNYLVGQAGTVTPTVSTTAVSSLVNIYHVLITQVPAASAASAVLPGAGSLTTAATQQAGATLPGAASLGSLDVQGSPATLGAAGAVTTAAVQGAGATLGGAGGLTAPSAQSAGATLGAAGSLAAPAAQGSPTPLAGAGSLGNLDVQGSPGTLGAAGALGTAAAQGAGATLGGAGSLAAPSTQNAGAVLGAAGSLGALATQRAGASLGGAGSVTGSASGAGSGTGTLGGAGSLAAPAVQSAPATLGGAGSIAVPSAQNAGGLLGGAGSLAAPAAQGAPTPLGGAGSLGTLDVQGSAGTLGGAGALGTTAAIQGSGGTLAGAGSLGATPVSQGAGETLGGAGSLGTAATTRAPATLAGAGSLAASAASGTAGAGTLGGQGSLAAPAAQQLAPASLAGTGSLLSAATLAAVTQLAGAGALGTAGTLRAGGALVGAGSLAGTGTNVPAVVKATGAATVTNPREGSSAVTATRSSAGGVSDPRDGSTSVS